LTDRNTITGVEIRLDGFSLSFGLGQLWLNLDPFPLLALPFGIAFHPHVSFLSSNLSMSLSFLKTCIFSWS